MSTILENIMTSLKYHDKFALAPINSRAMYPGNYVANFKGIGWF